MSETKKETASGKAGRGYEEKDASTRTVVRFGVGLALVCAVFFTLIWGLIHVLGDYRQRSAPEPSPFVQQRPQTPEPRLQVAPEIALQRLRAREDSILQSYGWVIPDSSVVRLPIARAIDLMAERGLPARPDTAASLPRAVAAPVTGAADSNTPGRYPAVAGAAGGVHP